MGAKTAIEWTATRNADGSIALGATWTPLRARNLKTGKVGWHCERISPGCERCYAERMNGRLGTGLTYTVPNRHSNEIFLDEKALTLPLRWRKPRKIFVCSMSDLFGEWVPDEWIDGIFAVMALAPQHTFIVLTKRAKPMREYFENQPGLTRAIRWAEIAMTVDPRRRVLWRAGDMSGPEFSWSSDRFMFGIERTASDEIRTWPGYPLPNCWLGVSAEDQQRLDERVPELLKTPAAVRFVSAEPLLERIVFHWTEVGNGKGGVPMLAGLDWVIVGSESGPGRRETDIEWVRSIRDQCVEAKVPLFLKQLHEGGKKLSTPELDGKRWVEFPMVRQ